MKYSYSTLLFLVVFSACAPTKRLQTVISEIPCVGSIGSVEKRLFSKEFKKVGESRISGPISVSIQSMAFTKATFNSYKRHRETLAKPMMGIRNDTLETVPRYFQLKISDFVTLKEYLNNGDNQGLRNYLEDDRDIRMLTGISFVPLMADKQVLQEADHVYLAQQDGRLILEAHNGMDNKKINMKTLEVFDFETATFCWKENKRNKVEIAVIATDGQPCPRGTEKKAYKLDETKQYLKL